MLSPPTTRGLLGIFTRGADQPATDPGATTPPVRLPTSLFLQAILVTGVGGRSARGGRAAVRARGRRRGSEQGREAGTGTLGEGRAS